MATITTNPQVQNDDEYVICPYCDEHYGDCNEYTNDIAQEMTCTNCSGVFTHEADYSVTYTTTPVRPPPTEDAPADDVAIAIALSTPDDGLAVIGEAIEGMAGALVDGIGDIAEGIGDAIGSIFEAVLGE